MHHCFLTSPSWFVDFQKQINEDKMKLIETSFASQSIFLEVEEANIANS